MALIFITGNQHKADFLAAKLGIPVEHQKVDLEEIQSLDLQAIVEHKAKSAFALVGKPVLVEDIALTLQAMNGLPGPLIKWFVGSIGNAGIAKLAEQLDDRRATVDILYGLYDGQELHFFEGHANGSIAPIPRGESWGFQNIFIPEGATKTFAEMTDEEMEPMNHRAKAIKKLRAYLQEHPILP